MVSAVFLHKQKAREKEVEKSRNEFDFSPPLLISTPASSPIPPQFLINFKSDASQIKAGIPLGISPGRSGSCRGKECYF